MKERSPIWFGVIPAQSMKHLPCPREAQVSPTARPPSISFCTSTKCRIYCARKHTSNRYCLPQSGTSCAWKDFKCCLMTLSRLFGLRQITATAVETWPAFSRLTAVYLAFSTYSALPQNTVKKSTQVAMRYADFRFDLID